MSVGRKPGSKPLAFITSLMVLFALVVPFIGSAVAQQTTTNLTITPTTDQDVVGNCNRFTVQARDNAGASDAGETIDIRATQADGDTNQDLRIAFCNPPAEGTQGTGAERQQSTGTGTGATSNGTQAGTADCDDNNNANDSALNATCPGGAAGITPTEAPAVITGECLTDANGQCVFGVTSNEAGTMNITVFAERSGTNNNTQDGTGANAEPGATATKTWVATGSANVTTITCTPETDQNPESSFHTITCTATNAQGQPVANAGNFFFDVFAGPNNEEVNTQPCNTQAGGAQTTNAQGQITCTYQDQGGLENPNSPPGTDQIRIFVNNSTATNATAGPDAGEPVDEVSKTFFGEGRVIDCEPETATNEVGTAHTVTCTVTDRTGQPVPGVLVDATTFNGPGTLQPTVGQDQTTNNAGQVTFTIQTGTNDAAGTSNLTARIAGDADVQGANNDNNDAGFNSEQECAQTAGSPAGSTAGVCSDSVQKTFTRTQQGGAECNDGIDNDGDGRIDHPNDRDCTDINDDTEQHFPERVKVATNLTIRYDPPVFKGSVGTPRKKCQQGRTVVLKKVVPGPNRTVGKDTSNREGSWGIRKRRARGRFYAVVTRKVFTNAQGDTIVCLRDKSVTINTRN